MSDSRKDPWFEVSPCQCGGECGCIVFTMFNPRIIEVDKADRKRFGDLCATLQFPKEYTEELIAKLRELSA